ncbi:PspC domain-containing protein [Membranihabitans marinus]|nr:PspC domain-containing protein [Membranihabitans marinus]
MNKIEYINLGGIPLAIDMDASQRLQDYLYELDDYFGKSDYADEIIRDIELRLAELIEESMGSRKVANMTDIEKSIAIMGRPDQFEQPDRDEPGETYAGNKESASYRRKLYRDPENKVIAGVCSGIAAYFDIDDPIWVRLAFAIIFFTAGAGVLLYIILWIVMPKARTSIDRLRMKGQPIDLENIERMMESGIDHISDFADKVSDKIKRKNRW